MEVIDVNEHYGASAAKVLGIIAWGADAPTAAGGTPALLCGFFDGFF
jgi:hypothetical protein